MYIKSPKKLNIITKLKNSLYKIYFKFLKKDKTTILYKNVLFNRLTRFHPFTVIYEDVDIRGSEINTGTYISKECYLPYTNIGKFCQIGKGVSIIIGDHPIGDNISTHPAFYSTLSQAGFHFAKSTTFLSSKSVGNHFVSKIGNDVWIGDGVKILNGVTIGDGAVLAAGSVVVNNVEPYTIVGGVPCKEIRKRFDNDTIDFLVTNPWCDLPLKLISKHHLDFTNIEKYKKFIETIKK